MSGLKSGGAECRRRWVGKGGREIRGLGEIFGVVGLGLGRGGCSEVLVGSGH